MNLKADYFFTIAFKTIVLKICSKEIPRNLLIYVQSYSVDVS